MRGQSSLSHHSLAKHTTFSRHCLADSSAVSKKMSASSLTNFVDIDRIIDDIKLAPQRQNNLQQHLSTINSSLAALRNVPGIVDEVRTIELLLESITKKLAGQGLAQTRMRHTQSVQRDSSSLRAALSPVKQFEEGSRIVYANFSLKDMTLETPIKRISMEQMQREESEQMEKLNNEIMVLEKMLKAKGVTSESKGLTSEAKKPQSSISLFPVEKNKTKENVAAAVPKKYSLMEKTQQIGVARQKGVRPRGQPIYR